MKIKNIQTFWHRTFWTKTTQNFGKYDIVLPGIVSPQKTVPDHIEKPNYYASGEPPERLLQPEVKNEQQICDMKKSCKLAANILKKIGETIRVNQTTDEIDNLVHDLCISNNAYPSTINYLKYPKSVCTSVNNVACHGIPDDRPLKDGDVINVDITVFYKGCHGDCSKTFLVGNVDEVGKNLVAATEICLNEAISICRPGQYFSEIGSLIEKRARSFGFGIIPAFAGHGIGRYFHGPPDIYHIRNSYPGQMEAGMTFTIEPVVTQGSPYIEILDDNWTAITADSARTAQFEHTVLITETGAIPLTIADDK